MKNLLLLSIMYALLVSAAPADKEPCYHPFDVNVYTSDNKAYTNAITLEDFNALERIFVSKNFCTNESMDTAWAYSFRFIFAPKEGPASMLSGSDNGITERMKEEISDAKAGDRILIEGIKVKINGETVELRPLVYTIKADNSPCYWVWNTIGEQYEILKSDLLELPKFYVSRDLFDNQEIDTAWVGQFRFIHSPADGPATMISGVTSSFNEKMIEAIHSAKPGDRILLEGMKIKIGDEAIILPPRVYTIKAEK
ncbi:hypothetical protein GYB22_11440 [bacterium]|nr:hypothetical protein [bacterium]